MEGIRLGGDPLQQLPISLFGFIQAARLMMHLRLAQSGRGSDRASRLLAVQLFFAATLLTIHASPSIDRKTGRSRE